MILRQALACALFVTATGFARETVDPDADGIPILLDNCPTLPNTDQLDADSDGAGDVCDLCPGAPDRPTGPGGEEALDFPAARALADYVVSEATADCSDAIGVTEDSTISFWLRLAPEPSQSCYWSTWDFYTGQIATFGELGSITLVASDPTRGGGLIWQTPWPWNAYVGLYGTRYIIPGEWIHVTLVFDWAAEASTVTLYYNGRFVASSPVSPAPSGVVDAPIRLGNPQRSDCGTLGFSIDDVTIFGDALDAAEVAAVYRGDSLTPARLRWSFGDSGLAPTEGTCHLTPTIRDGRGVAMTGSYPPPIPYSPTVPCFYPADYDQSTLWQYLGELSSTVEPFTTYRRVLGTIDPDVLLETYGDFKAWNLSTKLPLLADFMALSPSFFTRAYFYTRASTARPFNIPVGPDTTTPIMLFYNWDAEWNPVYRDAGLRNRAVVNSLIDLFVTVNNIYRPNGTNFSRAFNLGYSAYVFERVGDELPAEVRRAWLNTLDTALRRLIAASSETSQITIGVGETDIDLSGAVFINRLLILDRQFGAAPSVVELHEQIRDEWTHLLVDLKTREEFAEDYPLGHHKGVLSPGYCTMDHTINSSYNGLCIDHIFEIYHLAEQLGEPTYRDRIADTVSQMMKLRAHMTVIDSDVRWGHVSPAHYDSRRSTKSGFAADQSHNSEWTGIGHGIGVLEENVYGMMKRDYTAGLYQDCATPVSAFDWRVSWAVAQAGSGRPGTVLNARCSGPGAKCNVNRPRGLGGAYGWGSHNAATVLQDMTGPLDTEGGWFRFLCDHAKLPIEREGDKIESFGFPGEEGFYIAKRGDYYFTTYTGVTYVPTWRTGAGSGIASLTSRWTTEDGRTGYYSPILGRHLGWEITTRPTQCGGGASCPYLLLPGGADWREWPDHHVISRSASGEIRSTMMFDPTSTALERRTCGGGSLRTSNPFLPVNSYTTFNPASSACNGGGTGGCVERTYNFDRRNSLGIHTVLSGGFDSEDVYDSLPVFYKGAAGDPVRLFDESGLAVAGPLAESVRWIAIARPNGGIVIRVEPPTQVSLEAKPVAEQEAGLYTRDVLVTLADGASGEKHIDYEIVPYSGSTVPASLLTDTISTDEEYVTISAGDNHTCALGSDGSAWCWGDNAFGQLGNDSTVDSALAVPVASLEDAVAISTGARHSCSLLGDKTVYCWGTNDAGQLGIGTRVSSWVPVEVAVDDVEQLVVGGGHNCVLLGDRAVSCWGNNWLGQVGDGTAVNVRLSPTVLSGLEDVVSLTAGTEHTCALSCDGTVRCWGSNRWGQIGNGVSGYGDDRVYQTSPYGVSGLSDVSKVSAGLAHTCALHNNGTVSCWGHNHVGQLGDGTTVDRLAPVSVAGLDDAVAISAGGDTTCVLRRDASVVCWGNDYVGQLGDGFWGTGSDSRITTYSTLPVAVTSLSDVIEIEVGGSHVCAKKADLSIWCWGQNVDGQLGSPPAAGAPYEIAPVEARSLP